MAESASSASHGASVDAIKQQLSMGDSQSAAGAGVLSLVLQRLAPVIMDGGAL